MLLSINDIQAACRAGGSHWFDPDTLRAFGCVLDPEVYHGPGGIYFVSAEDKFDESGKEYTVRQFVQPDDIRSVDSAKQLQTLGEAHKIARSLACEGRIEYVKGPQSKLEKCYGLSIIKQKHRPVTRLQQFHAECLKHGSPQATESDCKSLMNQSQALDLQMVHLCNGDPRYNESFCEGLKKRIAKLAEKVGASGIITGGDPRGCVVKLTWPDGATNDWGKEGWCVPFLKDPE